MTTGIVFALVILLTLSIGLIQRRRKDRDWVQEERAEERGKYWDAGEQSWTSKRQQAELAERREAFLEGTADLLTKQILAFLIAECPTLGRDANGRPVATVQQHVEKNAAALLRDVRRFRATGVFEAQQSSELSPVGEALKKRIMAFLYRENPPFQELGSGPFQVLNRGVAAYSAAIMDVVPAA